MDSSLFLAFTAPNYLSPGLQSFAVAVTIAGGHFHLALLQPLSSSAGSGNKPRLQATFFPFIRRMPADLQTHFWSNRICLRLRPKSE